MPEVPEIPVRHRTRIIEVNPNKNTNVAKRHKHHSKTKSSNHSAPIVSTNNDNEEDPPFQIPLELMPVVKTLMGYGRRINALGALRGATALEKLIKAATPVAVQHPELVDALFEARAEMEAIRASAFRSLTVEDPE